MFMLMQSHMAKVEQVGRTQISLNALLWACAITPVMSQY